MAGEWVGLLAVLSATPSVGVLVVADGTMVRQGLIADRVQQVVLENTSLDVRGLDPKVLAVPLAEIRAQCAGQGACFARQLAPVVSTDLLLMVSVVELGASYSLSVRMLDIKARDSLKEAFGRYPTSKPVASVVPSLIEQTVSSQLWIAPADLTVLTEPIGVTVEVRSKTCLSPCTLTRLSPGEIRVIGKWEDEIVGQEELRLEPGQKHTLTLPVNVSKPSEWYTNPWLWTGVTAAVVAAGVATFFVVQGPQSRPACLSFGQEPCP